ncbi:glycosyltransferase [Massilia sp. R2A-15]|uniref:glycosyltransferase n=1 Tax=Massilia sp. R2A-15 TaxID=3064278 RepID=UPI002734AFD2|nr:glycosyltransferase [Massilia sp. R2A-15]WLI88270.1 glycosyltransferase [Massilia sp. R2A-15]
MRIVIDLQGAQSASRLRGIGRYSLALAQAIARNAGEHDIWLVMNGGFDGLAALQRAFEGLVPRERMRVFDVPLPVAELAADNSVRSRSAELLRESFIARLQPDAVLVTSLFEGYVDDAVTSVGEFTEGAGTAVVLYDLIPFLNPDAYLGTATQEQYYARKIASLRRAGLLLAISNHARDEAVQALGLDPASVVAILTAADAAFQPGPHASESLRRTLGITREIVMYAPGGTDARKNIEGLISAFGLLPAALRQSHQLLIASGIDAARQRDLRAHAARSGLAAGDLILTGHVGDATLIDLYRTAALFVFPSLHEGFGLPALEAMACGAPVIGADNSSIPEVIGCAEALFDASSPAAIAASIARVLQDPDLRERLRAHGRVQSRRFSWDATAQRSLRALEAHHARAPAAHGAAARRRLAFVSPLPPQRSGIADYAVQLLPELLAHFEIDLVVQQDEVSLPAALAALPRHSAEWFLHNAHLFDQILYQFGNSPFHGYMFPLLEAHPGVVVLHDFFLSRVLAYEQVSSALPGAWTEALYHSHGYPALRAATSADLEQAQDSYPCNLAVLDNATEVIVHSAHARELAEEWYGAGATGNWHVAPLPRSAPAQTDRAAARAALGIRQDAFVVCSFGFIAPTKLTARLVEAWIASSLHADPACELVLVGANHGGAYGAGIADAIRAAGPRIRIAGWTDDADYHRYLQAADAGVQLRTASRGETSAAVLDCMNYGLPTIVNASGSMTELPDTAILKLDEEFAPADLAAALERLRHDAPLRALLGENARALIRTSHAPAHCAQLYAGVLEQAWRTARTGRRALAERLARVPGATAGKAAMQQLAACMARLPDRLAQRQLLVDVTNIARHDLRTGIERVVRAQLLELLRRPLAGLRVEPVRLCAQGGRWQYRYARQYTCALLGIDAGAAGDAAVDIAPGDLFYGADYAPGAVTGAAREGLYAEWRERGVEISFQVYDLLPVLRPDFFPAGADRVHADWLRSVAANADRLICISAAVGRELRDWMAAQALPAPHPRVTSLHLGADLDGAPAPPAAPALPARFGAAPTFLMVGTIEPRKGHLQALAAFEQLWAGGVEANLVIVGGEGWAPLARAERRTIPQIVERLQGHAQLGKRLLWLKGAGDDQLHALYRHSACLLAPSEGEGFGLPLIEAARHGVPILARDLAVFREVAGEHASYFSDADGQHALADAIHAWLAAYAAGGHVRPERMPWMTWEQHGAALLGILMPGGRSSAC